MTGLFMLTAIVKGFHPTLDFVLIFAHSPNDVTVILVVVVEITRREIDVPSVGLVVLGTGPPRRSCCCVC